MVPTRRRGLRGISGGKGGVFRPRSVADRLAGGGVRHPHAAALMQAAPPGSAARTAAAAAAAQNPRLASDKGARG